MEKSRAIIATILIALLAVGAYLWSTKDQAPSDGEFVAADAPVDANPLASEIVDGIHVPTGLIADEGLNLVIANCTACHSAKLVTQNYADREGWKKMIRWMQSSQNLWELGTQEEVILDYLSKNYAPENSTQNNMGRRAPLTDIEWYELKN